MKGINSFETSNNKVADQSVSCSKHLHCLNSTLAKQYCISAYERNEYTKFKLMFSEAKTVSTCILQSLVCPSLPVIKFVKMYIRNIFATYLETVASHSYQCQRICRDG